MFLSLSCSCYESVYPKVLMMLRAVLLGGRQTKRKSINSRAVHLCLKRKLNLHIDIWTSIIFREGKKKKNFSIDCLFPPHLWKETDRIFKEIAYICYWLIYYSIYFLSNTLTEAMPQVYTSSPFGKTCTYYCS